MDMLNLPNDIIDHIAHSLVTNENAFPCVCTDFRDSWERIDGKRRLFWNDLKNNDFFYSRFDHFVRTNNFWETRQCLEYILDELEGEYNKTGVVDYRSLSYFYRHALYLMKHSEPDMIRYLVEMKILSYHYIHIWISWLFDKGTPDYTARIKHVNKILQGVGVPLPSGEEDA